MNAVPAILRCRSTADLARDLPPALDRHRDLFPADRDALVLLKPNLNSNMSALTGNTTDLRLLAAVVRYFKDCGYTRIVIGEGTNSGFYRNRIGVMARLMVTELARHYGVEARDFNQADPSPVEFANGVQAAVARECHDAALFVNLPKLKTHFEVGMSVCLKNLMGCLIGQENKKKTHQDLAANILHLNRQVRPHLHIVDGLVAMEGLGPTRGTPVRMDTVLVGTDPFLIDLVCARIAGFDWRSVRTLDLAHRTGAITDATVAAVAALDLGGLPRRFAPPKAGVLASFIHSPKRQKFFLRIRNTRLFTALAATRWFGHLLFLTGLRQDVFRPDNMTCTGLAVDPAVCRRCGACRDVCPLGRDPATALASTPEDCIHCLYCFSVCPHHAIRFAGDLGFFQEQLRQYDRIIRRLYASRTPDQPHGTAP
jgi:uncharacterized protein (DUF362 family)/ferredoxin